MSKKFHIKRTLEIHDVIYADTEEEYKQELEDWMEQFDWPGENLANSPIEIIAESGEWEKE